MIASPCDTAKVLLSQGFPSSEEELRALLKQEPEVGVYLILEQAKRIRELESQNSLSSSPSTPSGMVPPFQKPKRDGRKKKPGRKPGHPGARREKPTGADRQEDLRLSCCPDCGGPLQQCNGKQSQRTRIIEDIPKDIQPETVEYTLHRDYCPNCKKPVESRVPDALPRATIGNRLLTLSAYWHYGLGLTGSQIVDTLNHHLQFPVSEGGLLKMWHRLADTLSPWYEQLSREALLSAVLHADETGWRVNGQTHWLWCFTNTDTTFYLIDRSHGEVALKQFFHEEFQGTLVTDFLAVYEKVSCTRHQYCLAHLLRELKKVDAKNATDEWQQFSKKAKRLFRDALRLRAQEDFTPERYASRIECLYNRLLDLALAEFQDADAKRLAKRLHKYWDELLTFLDHPEVPSDNNHAEREIRFAVLIRKIIYGNRSEKGARTQSILMTVFRTLKRRGYNPINFIRNALQQFILNKELPPFPPPITSDQ